MIAKDSNNNGLIIIKNFIHQRIQQTSKAKRTVVEYTPDTQHQQSLMLLNIQNTRYKTTGQPTSRLLILLPVTCSCKEDTVIYRPSVMSRRPYILWLCFFCWRTSNLRLDLRSHTKNYISPIPLLNFTEV